MTELERIRTEARARERAWIIDSLERANGNVRRAARIYGQKLRERYGVAEPLDMEQPVSRPAFYRLMDKHGITRPKRAQP